MKWIVAIITMFLLFGCSDQTKKDAKEVSEKVQNIDLQKVVDKTVEKTKETASNALEVVKNTQVGKAVEETTVKAQEIVSAAVAKSGDITQNVKDEVIQVLDNVQKSPSTSSTDGSTLFSTKCASCHGSKAEKAALGQSEIIAGWDKDRARAAINGYKDGSYGKNMKMLMKGQVGMLSDDEVAALSNFISKQ